MPVKRTVWLTAGFFVAMLLAGAGAGALLALALDRPAHEGAQFGVRITAGIYLVFLAVRYAIRHKTFPSRFRRASGGKRR